MVVNKSAKGLCKAVASLSVHEKSSVQKCRIVALQRRELHTGERGTQTDNTDAGGVKLPEDFKKLPPNVVASYLAPLKHKPKYGHRVAQIQLRSYDTGAVEFFTDFVQRAGYYMKIPMSGPALLPKRREVWTLHKSPFVHKRSQENFERITYSRLITCYDANPETIEILLGYIKENGYPGVGVKANIFTREGLDAGQKLISRVYKSGIHVEKPRWYQGRKNSESVLAAKAILESPEYAKLMKDATSTIPGSTNPLQGHLPGWIDAALQKRSDNANLKKVASKLPTNQTEKKSSNDPAALENEAESKSETATQASEAVVDGSRPNAAERPITEDRVEPVAPRNAEVAEEEVATTISEDTTNSSSSAQDKDTKTDDHRKKN